MPKISISRRPLTMEGFIEIAQSKGWTLAAKDPCRPCEEVNLVDAGGRTIVAYPDETVFKHHIGIDGAVFGLVEIWQEGSLEHRLLRLDDLGEDLDEDLAGPAGVEALLEVLSFYDNVPDNVEDVRQLLSQAGTGSLMQRSLDDGAVQGSCFIRRALG